jgi:hypothetical protein
VSTSYNEARMTPQTEPRQTTLDARAEVWPPARTQRYWDYWGTQVFTFDLQVPHSTLTVTATATVDTRLADPPDETVTWSDLDTDTVRDRWCEYLLQTALTSIDGEPAAAAAELPSVERRRGRVGLPRHEPDLRAGVDRREHQRDAGVGAALRRVPGHQTRRDRPAAPRRRPGPVHLRVPAPDPSAAVGEPVVGQSHAWVEWWAGAWTPYDPHEPGAGHRAARGGRPGPRLRGRPPLKGVYSGPPSSAQGVTVEIFRIR